MLKRFAVILIFVVSILVSAINCRAQGQASHLEFIYQGLSATYNESFSRTDVLTINPFPSTDPDFGFDSRYTYHVNKFIGFGGAFEYRQYKGHLVSGNLSGDAVDDAKTKVIGVTGLIRAEAPYQRLIPYVFMGVGYRRVEANNVINGSFRFTFPPEEFHFQTKATVSKFGLEIGGGADFLITKKVFVLVELDYFNAGSALHSFGSGLGGGIRW